MDDRQEKKFETAMNELERVVDNLEKGDLELDEALAEFENGILLVRYLNKKLEQAETKVQRLLEQAEDDFMLEEIKLD